MIMHTKWYTITAIGIVGALVLFALAFNLSSAESEVQDRRGMRTVEIVLTEDGFEPRYVRIDAGTEVVFSNERDKPFWPASNLHPQHGIFPEFDPKRPIAPDEEWSFTFDEPGEWGFHDHVRSYFTGIIYVEEQ